jgi:hypothetical protein
MGKVYNIKGGGEDEMSPGNCEMKANDYEQKFILATAELVMDSFKRWI